MIPLGLCLVMFLASRAAAHESSADFALSSEAWSHDPWLMIPLYALGILFLLGTRAVWRRAGFGRGVRPTQVIAFWTAWLVLAVAGLSPLHWLSERLFTAHMIEHALLMVVAAPLLALTRPLAALAWSLPAAGRHWLNPVRNARPVAAIWRVLTTPIIATSLHAVTLWAWHLPALYVLALRDDTVHRVQHASFFFSALLFWWVLFYGRAHDGEEGMRDGMNVLWLFATALHSSLLGALMALSSRLWYPPQTLLSADWGLSPLEDQQLAGLVMWVPIGCIYAAAALYFASHWLRSASGKQLFELGETSSAASLSGPHRGPAARQLR
jgi:putative membrane protein